MDVFRPSKTVRIGVLPTDEDKSFGTEGISQPQGRDAALTSEPMFLEVWLKTSCDLQSLV